MAHEINADDMMFSVRETPWHGLGVVLPETPDVDEARIASGLIWECETTPMCIMDGNSVIDVPDNFAVVRQDTKKVLGVVGNRYQIYSNQEMWDFIAEFKKQSDIELETAGSLRSGKTTWVLAKKGQLEAMTGDVLQEYFLFRNSFDGSTPISVLFTDIRVVCNNTLSAALRGARNQFNVRHTSSASEQIKEVQKALGVQYKYKETIKEVVAELVKKAVTATETVNILNDVIFPMPSKIIQTVGANNQPVHDLKDATQHALTTRKNKIDKVLELVETGAGTDIPGVKGTLWGVYNAITEWADHDKTVRGGGNRNALEAKFENAFFGTGAKFKADALNELLLLAA